MQIRLEYIKEYRDRHGKLRRYFRRRGQRDIALSGKPGSTEFQEAYNAARASMRVREIGANRSAPGSVGGTIGAYYTHNGFLGLALGTQRARRAILERFRAEHGDKPLRKLTRGHVTKILSGIKPFAARNWLMTLRGLMQFAVEVGIRGDDPTAGIDPVRAKQGAIHTWTEDEIAQFEAYHPIGSRPRLAMALLLYTAQRRSDVIKMGPQHVRDGVLTLRQQKTGTPLVIPVHPELAQVITASPCGNLAFLVTGEDAPVPGVPISNSGIGNAFRRWCDAAGLSATCSSHGLRKAACRRLAEAGCSVPQIAAISGHKSLREIQHYIAEADQARLARAAFQQLRKGTAGDGAENDLSTSVVYPILKSCLPSP
jgi:integrase